MTSFLQSFQFFTAGAAISLFPAILPSHWLPFILLGRAERWSQKKTLGVLMMAGGGHVLITSTLGFGVAAFGKALSNTTRTLPAGLASVILIIWGGVYTIRNKSHHHPEGLEEVALRIKARRNRLAALSLFLMLTLSPCEAIIPVFFAASHMGWGQLVVLVSGMALATLGGMVLLAYGFNKGLEKMRWEWLEHHENKVIGLVLILLGLLVLWQPEFH